MWTVFTFFVCHLEIRPASIEPNCKFGLQRKSWTRTSLTIRWPFCVHTWPQNELFKAVSFSKLNSRPMCSAWCLCSKGFTHTIIVNPLFLFSGGRVEKAEHQWMSQIKKQTCYKPFFLDIPTTFPHFLLLLIPNLHYLMHLVFFSVLFFSWSVVLLASRVHRLWWCCQLLNVVFMFLPGFFLLSTVATCIFWYV